MLGIFYSTLKLVALNITHLRDIFYKFHILFWGVIDVVEHGVKLSSEILRWFLLSLNSSQITLVITSKQCSNSSTILWFKYNVSSK